MNYRSNTMNDACCVIEYRTKLELEVAQRREGLLAFEQNYNLRNVLSLSPQAQETYWKLRNEKGTQ